MQRFIRRLIGAGAVVLFVGLAAERALADEAANPVEATIRKALDEKTVAQFVETPLRDVVDYLADKHKIAIQIDKRALDDAGLGTDTPVTRSVKGISLRSLLRLMLKEYDLTFVIDNEVLLLTTVDEAGSRLHTQIYDVEDLVVTDAGVDYDSLILMIATTVAPTTWDEVGGPGSISTLHRTLIISQTEEVHEQIESLLAHVRRVLKARKDKAPASAAGPLPASPQPGIVRTYRVNVPQAQKPSGSPKLDVAVPNPPPANVDAAAARLANDRYVEELARAIPSLVKPETWERGGGTGVIHALPTNGSGTGQLLVRQSEEVHWRLHTFLMNQQIQAGVGSEYLGGGGSGMGCY